MGSLARPNPLGVNANDQAAMSKVAADLAAKTQLLDSFHTAGQVSGVPPMTLTDTLTASLRLDPALQPRYGGTEGSTEQYGGTEQYGRTEQYGGTMGRTLRVAVPSLVQDAARGCDAVARPTPMRPPRQFDRRRVPQALQVCFRPVWRGSIMYVCLCVPVL